MTLSLGFSPCPNDTFIFDALVNNLIHTGDYTFKPVLEDVETLNQWALQGKLDITKLSFPAFFQSVKEYVLLDAGSALGKGVGPLLIKATPGAMTTEQVSAASVVLPGAHTTANLLFSFAYPQATQKTYRIFSSIENAVLTGETDLGVIIHESRFTYHDRGLFKVLDLGDYWEKKMNVPIPLGAIAMKRSFGNTVSREVSDLIKKSLQYAFEKYPLVSDYVKKHSQEMEESVMRQHIDLYVNDYSLDLGDNGKKAIHVLHEVYAKNNSEGAGPSDSSLFLLLEKV